VERLAEIPTRHAESVEGGRRNAADHRVAIDENDRDFGAAQHVREVVVEARRPCVSGAHFVVERSELHVVRQELLSGALEVLVGTLKLHGANAGVLEKYEAESIRDRGGAEGDDLEIDDPSHAAVRELDSLLEHCHPLVARSPERAPERRPELLPRQVQEIARRETQRRLQKRAYLAKGLENTEIFSHHHAGGGEALDQQSIRFSTCG
jgi:hypothetical protein